MTKPILPSVFLGKITDFSNEIATQYVQTLKEFFKNYKDSNCLVVCSSDSIEENEYEIDYETAFTNSSILNELNSVLEGLGKNPKESHSISPSMVDYFVKLGFDKNKIIFLTVNLKNKSKSMELGKKLQFVRNKNLILLGLGNITHLPYSQTKTIQESVKEFDAWVRVKLWEFDYYALRDIEAYFPFEKHEYLDNIGHYVPFLVIFGSLTGTDVLNDLFTGFEGNNSLRSFYFDSQVL